MPRSTLFPYTTLFRSVREGDRLPAPSQGLAPPGLRGFRHAGIPGDDRAPDRAAPAAPVGVPRTAGPEDADDRGAGPPRPCPRSEEHTSELQSRLHLVCRDLHSFPTRRSSDLFEKAIGFRPPLRGWLRRAFVAFATPGYLGTIALLTGLLLLLLLAYLAQLDQRTLTIVALALLALVPDRKSTRLNSSHGYISYAEIYTLSLHDALPICSRRRSASGPLSGAGSAGPSWLSPRRDTWGRSRS